MNIEKNIIAFNNEPCKTPCEWPRLLARALPSLLYPLVDQRSCQSLERLQVVSLSIDMIKAPVRSDAINTNSRMSHPNGDEEFLELTEDLLLGNGDILRCTLLYFVRGKRRYFQQAQVHLGGEISVLSTINPGDIKTFYEALGQPSSALYVGELAELAGRARVIVPIPMLVTIVLEHVLACLPRAHHFHVSFLRAIKGGQHMSMIHRIDNNDLHAAIETSEGPALYVHSCQSIER